MGYSDDYPLLLIYLTSLVVILGASEIGRWLARGARGRGGVNVSALEGGMYGLLALMIGFTFAIALSRFEERRGAVLNEANAIGTTALRARLLPAPYNTESLKLLREYAQLRVAITRHRPSLMELNAAIARSNSLQEELWKQAIAGVAKGSSLMPNSPIFDSLNDMINSQRKRLAVFSNLMPEEVLITLYGIATLAIGFAGYAQGLGKRPLRLPIYLMGVLVCTVILLIEDLESPFSGFISVSQQPLIDAAASIANH